MRLDWLRAICTSEGPFATVVVDVSHAVEDAAHRADLRRRAVRDGLADQGAPEAALALVDAALSDAPPAVGSAGRALVVDSRAVLVDVALPAPPPAETISWGTPQLLAVVDTAPERVATVVVRVDEEGGEVLVSGGDEPEQVRGRDKPVHKVRGGGWSHLAMQERVEETWRRNTADVAARVDERVRTTGARLLVIAGDTRSRARLRDALPERSAAIAVDVPHSATAAPQDLTDAVTRAVERLLRAERRAAFARFTELAGKPDGLAATGLADVLLAARAEAIDTLFLDPARLTAASVWVGDQPAQIASARSELVDLGVAVTAEMPAASALIRAAACVDASLVVLDDPAVTLGRDPLDDGPAAPEEALFGGDTLADGVGAILRFPIGETGPA